MHINYKEVCAVASAVARWAPLWAGPTVVVHTDSAVTKAILNKARSKNAFINDVLRAVCWRSVTFDFKLRAIHLPGSLIGRPPPAPIAAHMSGPSYHFLCQQLQQRSWRRHCGLK